MKRVATFTRLFARHQSQVVFDVGMMQKHSEWNSKILFYSQHDTFDKCLTMYDEMKKEKIIPSQGTLIILMKAMFKAKNLSKVRFFHNEWDLTYLYPKNSYYYSCLMTGYGQLGDFEKVDLLYQSLQKRDWPMTLELYHTLLSLSWQQLNFDRVERTLAEMKSNGMEWTDRTWRIMITGYARNNLDEKVDELYSVMKEKELMDGPLYTILVTLYFKKDLTRAIQVWNDLESSGCVKDLELYTSGIRMFLRMGDATKAVGLFKEMKANKIEFDEMVYQLYLRTLMMMNEFDRAEATFKSLKSSNLVKVNHHLYNQMIQGMLTGKQLQRAKKYYLQMKEDGIMPDRVTMAIFKKSGINDPERITRDAKTRADAFYPSGKN